MRRTWIGREEAVLWRGAEGERRRQDLEGEAWRKMSDGVFWGRWWIWGWRAQYTATGGTDSATLGGANSRDI